MSRFEIVDGACSNGPARYEAGLFALPDGSRRGIETLSDLQPGDASGSQTLASLRNTLPRPGALPLPLRLAVSSLRAGLSVAEEGIAPGGTLPLTLRFADGLILTVRMPPALADAIRRDRELVAGVLARAGNPSVILAEPVPELAPDTTDTSLTSIFRYEKRGGRLRRVAIANEGAEA